MRAREAAGVSRCGFIRVYGTPCARATVGTAEADVADTVGEAVGCRGGLRVAGARGTRCGPDDVFVPMHGTRRARAAIGPRVAHVAPAVVDVV